MTTEFAQEYGCYGPTCMVRLPKIASECTKDEILNALKHDLRLFGFKEPYQIIHMYTVLDAGVAALDALGRLSVVQCWQDGDSTAFWGYVNKDADYFSLNNVTQPDWLYIKDPGRYTSNAV